MKIQVAELTKINVTMEEQEKREGMVLVPIVVLQTVCNRKMLLKRPQRIRNDASVIEDRKVARSIKMVVAITEEESVIRKKDLMGNV